LNPKAMNPSFILSECEGEQDKHYDQGNALFVFRQLENPE